jgi:hypothetical protein
MAKLLNQVESADVDPSILKAFMRTPAVESMAGILCIYVFGRRAYAHRYAHTRTDTVESMAGILCIYVYMYICMCTHTTHVYTCMRKDAVCMYICMCTHGTRAYTNVEGGNETDTRIRAQIRVCNTVFARARTHTHTQEPSCTGTRTHAHTHTRAHTPPHTHTQEQSCTRAFSSSCRPPIFWATSSIRSYAILSLSLSLSRSLARALSLSRSRMRSRARARSLSQWFICHICMYVYDMCVCVCVCVCVFVESPRANFAHTHTHTHTAATCNRAHPPGDKQVTEGTTRLHPWATGIFTYVIYIYI